MLGRVVLMQVFAQAWIGQQRLAVQAGEELASQAPLGSPACSCCQDPGSRSRLHGPQQVLQTC